MSAGAKDIVRPLTPAELEDMRAREIREGSPYSDRDMLLDHAFFLAAELARECERTKALTEALRRIEAMEPVEPLSGQEFLSGAYLPHGPVTGIARAALEAIFGWLRAVSPSLPEANTP